MRKRCHLLSRTDFSCDGFITLLTLALTPFKTKGSTLKYARFFKIGGFGSGKDTVKSKKWCKDQESIQSSTTPDPGYQWESDKLTEDTTNESQEVSPFPAGDHKAHINRRAQNIANTRQNKNIKDPQKKYRLGTVSKIFY